MKEECGRQPKSETLKRILAEATILPKYVSTVVHHYTDTPDKLQLEVEQRVPDPTALGGTRCFFGRWEL